MARLSQMRTDARRCSEGVWFPDPWGLGTRHKIASVKTPGFAAEVQRLVRLNEEKAPGDAQVESASARAIAVHLWLDWEGIEDDDGETVPYSIEKATAYLLDPDMSHWSTWISSKAADIGIYLTKTTEETGKP